MLQTIDTAHEDMIVSIISEILFTAHTSLHQLLNLPFFNSMMLRWITLVLSLQPALQTDLSGCLMLNKTSTACSKS